MRTRGGLADRIIAVSVARPVLGRPSGLAAPRQRSFACGTTHRLREHALVVALLAVLTARCWVWCRK
ncbi:MAG: hypothetical protein WCO57_04510 [Verrucomicrobiota bacterium]